MGVLRWIFGGGASAGNEYGAELERVKREAAYVRAQRKEHEPGSSENLDELIRWYRKRISLLLETKYHPLARLQAVPLPAYRSTLDAYCGALEKLSADPADAKSKDVRAEILREVDGAIAKELPRMQAKLAELERRNAA